MRREPRGGAVLEFDAALGRNRLVIEKSWGLRRLFRILLEYEQSKKAG
jgi:hypothetical protein